MPSAERGRALPAPHRVLLPLAGCALVVGLFLERFVFESEPLVHGSGDLRRDFLPLYEITYGWLGEGRMPLWNPSHLTGIPVLGALQGGTFYPGHLLYLVLPATTALAVSTALHLALVALSLVWLGRTLGLSLPAATLLGVLLPTRGITQWWVLWPNMLETSAWLATGCVAVAWIARGRLRPGALLLALATGVCLLAGHAQVALFLLIAWSTLLVALLWPGAAGSGRATPAPALATFAGALVVGALIGAIQLLPAAEMTLEGTRSVGALPVEQVMAMGHAWRTPMEIASGAQFSLGFLALALAPFALLTRTHGRVALWAAALALVTGMLASAATDWLIDAYRATPGIGSFRSPRRLSLLVHLGVAVLAAIGFDAVRARVRGRVRLTVTAVVLALAAGDAVTASTHRGRMPYGADAAATYRRHDAFYRDLAERAGEDRVAWLPYRPVRNPELKRAALLGLRFAGGFEPLNLARHAQYFTFFEYGTTESPNPGRFFAGPVIHHRRSPPRELAARLREMAGRRRLLDLAAVRYYVTDLDVGASQLAATRPFVDEGALRPVRSSDPAFELHESPAVLPRAYVVYDARPAPDVETLLAALAAPDFDPLETSYVDGPVARLDAMVPASGVPAKIVRDEARLVEVEAKLEAPGFVVLADAYARGWRATVDGEPAPIHPANHLFRGVPVPAGRHVVRFEYRPASVPVGAGLSLAGVALVVALAVASRSSGASARP